VKYVTHRSFDERELTASIRAREQDLHADPKKYVDLGADVTDGWQGHAELQLIAAQSARHEWDGSRGLAHYLPPGSGVAELKTLSGS